MGKGVHYPNLDAARFVAAFAVVLDHYFLVGPAQGWVAHPPATGALGLTAHLGLLGVCVFFAISGFVILAASEGKSFGAFVTSRVVRLAPGFLLCMSLTAIALNLAGSQRAPDLATWMANLVLLPQLFGHGFVDGVYWSLVYEVVFYGWVALAIAAGLLPRRLPEITAAWLAIAVADRLWIGSPVLERLFATEFTGFFVMGVSLYLLLSGRNRRVATALMLAALLLASHALTTFGAITDGERILVPAPAYWQCLALAGGVLAVVALAVRGPQIPLSSGLALMLGGVSYPLYLLHQELGYATMGQLARFMPAGHAAAATIAAAVALSWAVWRFAEEPARRALRRAASTLAVRPSANKKGAAEAAPVVPAE